MTKHWQQSTNVKVKGTDQALSQICSSLLQNYIKKDSRMDQ